MLSAATSRSISSRLPSLIIKLPATLGLPSTGTMSETPPAPAPAQARQEARTNMNHQRAAAQKAPPAAPKREVKILMLHGYTQSGPLFRAKTRALEKLLAKSLDPKTTTLTLVYPTGPTRLRPSDIPGYAPSSSSLSPPSATPTSTAPPEDDDIDSWAWFRRDPTLPHLRGLPDGMTSIASAVHSAGGVDGVVGFSQGGAVAALVASALEPARDPPPAPAHLAWVTLLRAANAGRALRFAVVYSGFHLPTEDVAWCYDPPLETPTLHYIGGLDTVVEEGRSRALVERCGGAVVAVHPGGHYVPVSREWVMPIAGFVRKAVEEMGEA